MHGHKPKKGVFLLRPYKTLYGLLCTLLSLLDDLSSPPVADVESTLSSASSLPANGLDQRDPVLFQIAPLVQSSRILLAP
jgi:hypothetical protein